jgi:NADPH-dependent glutamate synthase beta subunit-like oxidoreductase
MTATKDELEEGKEEGVILHSGHSFLRITGENKVEGVELQKVKNFYFDEARKPVIELEEGTKEIVAVDNVIFAVGQRPAGTDRMDVELSNGSYIKVNQSMETNLSGVYAAGDVVTGTKSVIEAIAAGRKCAEAMDKFLGGNGDISEQLLESGRANPFIGRMEGFADLERITPETLPVDSRIASFETVDKPFTCEEATCEATRCLQCDLRLNLTKPKLWTEY